ncbi:hypothetical protein [Luteolibacter soli]|uniref:RRM domain-containing protein n=1 Tax=Luteolibacter soli TaxID=3135280 RepID=A0ABU9ARF2_9BACT
MSNATPDTRGTGDGERRRRRSRGGKGRNRNRQDQDPNNSNSHHGQKRSHGGGDRNRNERGGERGDRGDRIDRGPRKEYKPAPLTLWQKIKKIFGLYKEPVRPPRERREPIRFEDGPPREQREPKSNVRIAKQPSEQRSREDRPAREDRPPREERAPREERQRRSPERGDVASARIYLGNLSYDCTEEDLKDLFKGVGTVRNVEIVYNRRTHKSKGYGFVDMLNVDEAKRSVEVLHDQFFMGRQLVVSGAKTKEHEDALKEETAAPADSTPAAPSQPVAQSEPVAAAESAASATSEEPTA